MKNKQFRMKVTFKSENVGAMLWDMAEDGIIEGDIPEHLQIIHKSGKNRVSILNRPKRRDS